MYARLTMAEKRLLDADKILKKKFKAKSGGYDALEVDEFFDLVRNDYESMLEIEKELKLLRLKNETQQAKIVNLEAQYIQYKKKVEELERLISKGGTAMENLRKIDKYERQLWKMGIDPSKLK